MNNGGPSLEIEKDLVRWPRAKWAAVVILVLAFQTGLLFTGSESGTGPAEPPRPALAVTFAPSGAVLPEWIESQDPSLFASANRRGFSGPAWMIQPPWTGPAEPPLPAPRFLAFEVARRAEAPRAAPLPAVTHARSRPEPSAVALPVPEVPPASGVRVEDLAGRRLETMPPAPVQYANDVIRPSVVQVLIDPDGSVLSSRLLAASGSKAADQDALALAKKARFEPLAVSAGPEIETARLVFEWQTLNLSQTNGVTR